MTKKPTRRAAKKAHYRKHRPAARETAYARDGGRCRWPTCRLMVQLESDSPWQLANAHEIAGGRSSVDPTDPAKIATLCCRCHEETHVRIGGKRKRIEGNDANKPLRFFERPRGKGDWMEVGPDPITEAE